MSFVKPKVKAPSPELIGNTERVLKRYNTNTICLESKCPNIAECFARGTATFLILGDICTRQCKFCNVTHAKPLDIDPMEPERVASAVQELGLSYVVVTSVDRDDLDDLGADQFVKTIRSIKMASPRTKIEVLTPDFQAKKELLGRIIDAKPYKLAHNIETVQRLSKKIMPGCSYTKSLKVLEYYAGSGIMTKSSIMVGLGESLDELRQSFQDLASAGVMQLTIGQYLQPSPNHAPVAKYYTPEEFELLREIAQEAGIHTVVSGVLVRSSYYADKL